MVWTNLPSAAVAAGSACGPTDRPRVSGFFSGASARRIWSSVTFVVAGVGRDAPMPNDSAAPIVTIERIAVRFSFQTVFDIASPSCALSARFQISLQMSCRTIRPRPTTVRLVFAGARPRVRGGAGLNSNNRHCTP